MMRWWLDRGVEGFRMDVINLISKDVAPDGALRDGHEHVHEGMYGDGSPHFMNGPRLHELLQGGHREVFAGTGRELLTVGRDARGDRGRPGRRTSAEEHSVSWYSDGMRTTIDSAGRVVLPRALRLDVGIVPGEVEIVVDGNALRISPVAADELTEEDGLLLLSDGPAMTDDDVRHLRLADQR
jgi:bifunctional DNA-binding transcriptional regulator/antitoxin component of YhaV-PrlF toxin-antitoxin module